MIIQHNKKLIIQLYILFILLIFIHCNIISDESFQCNAFKPGEGSASEVDIKFLQGNTLSEAIKTIKTKTQFFFDTYKAMIYFFQLNADDKIERIKKYKFLIYQIRTDTAIQIAGISRSRIISIFFNPELGFNQFLVKGMLADYMHDKAEEIIGIRIPQKERPIAGIRPNILEEGLEFYRVYRSYFQDMESKLGVNRFHVASILTNETRCGFFTGTNNVLESFISMASINRENYLFNTIDSVMNSISKQRIKEDRRDYQQSVQRNKPSRYRSLRTGASQDKPTQVQSPPDQSSQDTYPHKINEWEFKNPVTEVKVTINPEELKKQLIDILSDRIISKSKWGIQNIVALLLMEYYFNIDIDNLYGSYAGAFGLCQFLPNSFLFWARDGNGDEYINLFEPADAIFSCGNYLKEVGYDGTSKGIYNAIYHYNNSDMYVRIIMQYADAIKEKDIKDKS